MLFVHNRRGSGGTTSPASESAAGVVELATALETTIGTDAVRAVSPARLTQKISESTVSATQGRAGIVEIATNAESLAGTDPARAVSPEALKHVMDTTAGGTLSTTQQNKLAVAPVGVKALQLHNQTGPFEETPVATLFPGVSDPRKSIFSTERLLISWDPSPILNLGEDFPLTVKSAATDADPIAVATATPNGVFYLDAGRYSLDIQYFLEVSRNYAGFLIGVYKVQSGADDLLLLQNTGNYQAGELDAAAQNQHVLTGRLRVPYLPVAAGDYYAIITTPVALTVIAGFGQLTVEKHA